MSKKVIYTVGANLNGPIEVEHFVDGDTSKTKKQKDEFYKLAEQLKKLKITKKVDYVLSNRNDSSFTGSCNGGSN